MMLLAFYLAGALGAADTVVVSTHELAPAASQSLRYAGQCGPHALALQQAPNAAPLVSVDRKPAALSSDAKAFLAVRGAAYRAYSRCDGQAFKLVVHRVTWEDGKGEAYAIFSADVAAGGAVTGERFEVSTAEGFFYR